MANRTERPSDTLSPGDFEIGSSESRAAARLLAGTRIEPRLVFDGDFNPQWNPNALYGRLVPEGLSEEGRTMVFRPTMTEHEIDAWLPQPGESQEANDDRHRREAERFRANENAFYDAYDALLEECGGRVTGAVAMARIPKGLPVSGTPVTDDAGTDK